MELKEMYIIWYTESNGTKYIEVITDNPKEWLKNHNKDREFGEHEHLDDFEVQRTTYQKFNNA